MFVYYQFYRNKKQFNVLYRTEYSRRDSNPRLWRAIQCKCGVESTNSITSVISTTLYQLSYGSCFDDFAVLLIDRPLPDSRHEEASSCESCFYLFFLMFFITHTHHTLHYYIYTVSSNSVSNSRAI